MPMCRNEPASRTSPGAWASGQAEQGRLGDIGKDSSGGVAVANALGWDLSVPTPCNEVVA
jgi:hypothetical protein